MLQISIDSECFGLFPFHGDHPFTISICTHELEVKVYEADRIFDSERRAVWSSKAIREINQRIAKADRIVGHNLKYDALVMQRIGVNLLQSILDDEPHLASKRFQDTATLSHIIFNNEPHGLKELAWKYLGIPALDEYLLHEAVNEVHNLRRSYDNAIFKGKEPKSTAIDIDYAPHPLSSKESSNDCDFHLARHHPTLGKICSEYAGRDALRNMLLWLSYQSALQTELSDRFTDIERVYDREKRLIFALLRQAPNPIHLRKKALSTLIKEGESALSKLENEILKIGRKYSPELENPNSDAQIGKLLYDKLNLPVIKLTKKAGRPSTDRASLKTLLTTLTQQKKPTAKTKDGIVLLQKLLEYAKVNTITNYNRNYRNYAIGWDSKHPYLVFNFNPQGTKFVRGSSSKPNLQNVGGKDKDKALAEYLEEFSDSHLYSTSLRSSFGPIPGKVWFSIDYSQIELQVFAWACQSQRLKDLLNNGDVHDAVERDLFGTSNQNRTLAKIANFSLIYGKQEPNFDAMTFPGAYKKYTTELFPEVGPYIRQTSAYVKKHGYVTTASGYRIHIDQDKPYVGVNAICQGTAGDIIKLAMVGIDEYLRNQDSTVQPILQVHDELVFLADEPNPKVHERLSIIRRIMELSAVYYGIPCKTDLEIIRVSWDAPEKYVLPAPSKKAADRIEKTAKAVLKRITTVEKGSII